ncbi:MAG: hypothetical protein AAFY26_26175 [Cyanobacteria bacterium J06638_22]
MSTEPTLSAEELAEQLRGSFEQLCQDVATAVNDAPAGAVINASEEQVRDLLAKASQLTYQTAVQLRTDAAQAAFSPSSESDDRKTSAEQGAGAAHDPHRQRSHYPFTPPLRPKWHWQLLPLG